MPADANSTKPSWRFAPIPDDQVAPDVTQRDQFNNEAVELYQALVREAIQNSTDQPSGNDPVKLRFAIRELEGPEAARLRELIEPIRPNCEACGLDTSMLEQPRARVLVVEDFNTTGLAGAIDTHDDGQFAGFWRRHGGSNKDSSKGGSHGLGKLVFSASSAVGAVFGHTIRADGRSLLMGQAILVNHKLDGKRLPAHGFWTVTNTPGRIQLPTESSEVIADLAELFGFSRKKETGLSIAVPYVPAEIDHESLRRAVVTNYFFSILSGSLVVEVGGVIISRATFSSVAETLGLSKDELHKLEFVVRLLPMLEKPPSIELEGDYGARRLGDEPLPEEIVEKLQKAWSSNEIASVRLPFKLKPRHGPTRETYVDLFLSKKPDDASGWALFARNALVVPGESRLSFSEPAFGALIARDAGACALLRDAEDPAHIRWNAKEKLKKNWMNGPQVVLNIRLSLRALYRQVTSELREEHPDLLVDFLSIRDHSPKRGARRRTPPKPPKPITPRARFFEEDKIDGGFRISAGPGAAQRPFPVKIRIKAAYDVLSGDPFKLHSEHDFSFAKHRLQISTQSAEVIAREHGWLQLECKSELFQLEVTGFDQNRDLIVEGRVVE